MTITSEYISTSHNNFQICVANAKSLFSIIFPFCVKRHEIFKLSKCDFKGPNVGDSQTV
jgi:hypothetical protein